MQQTTNIAPGAKLTRRYQIISKLGQGGFGKTFLARDLYFPGDRICVVKQLKPQINSLSAKTAKRLFENEAKILCQLGNHSQIPQLYAYFEEDGEFYLVEEYIEGHDLSEELSNFPQKDEEEKVITLIREILEILEFVHQNKVIHRDISPRNIIRRKSDGKLVLIDFGAVKKITCDLNRQEKAYTIAIGTPGYRPSEQASGKPKLSSDIYAVGAIAIQALTSRLPHTIPTDKKTGEISWQPRVKISRQLFRFINTMVRYDFRDRYKSATEALDALNNLYSTNIPTLPAPEVEPITDRPDIPHFLASCLSRIFILFFIIGIGTTGFVSIDRWKTSSKAAQLYKQGQTFSQSQRYEEALQSYYLAVEITPNYQQAWKGQGDALQNLKRYEEAINAYDKAIQIRSDYWEAWMAKAVLQKKLGKQKDAIESFKGVTQIKPDYLEAWQELTSLQLEQKQYSQAVTSFDRINELQPDDAGSWYQKGLLLHKLKDYRGAINSFDRAVEIKRDDYRFWYQRGNSLTMLKRYQQAIRSYQKALRYKPNLYQARYSQGMAFISLKDYQNAIAAFDRTVKIKPNYSKAWYHRGWSLHQLKKFHSAISSYNKALKYNRNYYQAWYNRGNCYFNLKKYSQALADYDRALKIKPNYPEAWYSKGNTLLKLKRFKKANYAFSRALHYKPNYPEAKQKKRRSLRLSEIIGD
ncbi:MAG: tetratricopeptide repeat protein [Prochloraceae cyanobacterium]|nr:tetratricopeptide repeat protein [Prochloraceae cyanobacterium]